MSLKQSDLHIISNVHVHITTYRYIMYIKSYEALQALVPNLISDSKDRCLIT